MLPDRVKELLCRAIDGDIDDRQRRALQQLLLENEEARSLFHRLRLDAQRLKDLPRKELPAHFASGVLQSLGHESAISPASMAKTAQKYLPMWANLAAALAVLFAVSLGTYMLVSINEKQREERQNAERKQLPPAPEQTPKHSTPAPEIAHTDKTNDNTDNKVDVLPPPREDDIAVAPLPEFPEAKEPDSKEALTAPFDRTIDLFKVNMPKLPPIMVVRELDKALLKNTIKGEDAIHLDLFCDDANKGFDRVLHALRGQGRKVLVETLAQRRLQAKVKTDYVIFAETLTTDDIVKLFATLSAEDKDAKQLEKLVAVPMSATNQKTLAMLLGVDVKTLKPKPAEKPDPSKPISDSTADKLAKALEKGGARPADSAILALSYNPIRPRPDLSKEVRDFVAGRKDRRPGTVAVMLVIRNID